MLDLIARSRKAVMAFAGTAIAAYLAANEDGKITETEWVIIAGSLVVGLVTYFVKNRQPAEGVQTRSGPSPY
jgi:hypothetical protein